MADFVSEYLLHQDQKQNECDIVSGTVCIGQRMIPLNLAKVDDERDIAHTLLRMAQNKCKQHTTYTALAVFFLMGRKHMRFICNIIELLYNCDVFLKEGVNINRITSMV